MQTLLNGNEIEAARFGVNDGLNFGRFDGVDRPLVSYELRVTRAELLSRIEGLWNSLVDEMRADDRLDETPSALARMGYPTLEGAFAFPASLGEVVETFLAVSVLNAFTPLSSGSMFVMNSVDAVVVDADSLSISGRCFTL